MTNSGYEMQLAEKDDRIAELKRKLANEQARDIHSCHPDCTREGCVNRRLRAELVKADGWREKYEDAKQQLVKAQWAIGAHTYWKARALDFEVERDIAVSTLEKVKADRTVAKNAQAEQCKHTKTIEQQLAAEQAKNVELRELVEHFALIDLGRNLLPGDFGLWVLRARKAISTPDDTSALEAIVKKTGEMMRENCITAAGPEDSYQDDWIRAKIDACDAIRALPAVTLEDLK